MVEPLKPCPFCGSADICAAYSVKYSCEEIWCDDCGCTFSEPDSPQAELVARWNRRAAEAEIARIKLHLSAWEDSARINKDRAERAEAEVERLTQDWDEAAKKREDEISATAEFIDLMNNQIEVNTKATAAVMDALRAELVEEKRRHKFADDASREAYNLYLAAQEDLASLRTEVEKLTKALALAILATT